MIFPQACPWLPLENFFYTSNIAFEKGTRVGNKINASVVFLPPGFVLLQATQPDLTFHAYLIFNYTKIHSSYTHSKVSGPWWVWQELQLNAFVSENHLILI